MPKSRFGQDGRGWAVSGAGDMGGVRARVTEAGRVGLPAAGFREAVGPGRGGDVVVELVAGREVRTRTLDEAVARAQELTREILGERRREAEEAG